MNIFWVLKLSFEVNVQKKKKKNTEGHIMHVRQTDVQNSSGKT